MIYVEKIYVQHSHSVYTCWQSEKEPGVLTKIGIGQRLSLNQEGFVLRFPLHFQEWTEKQ